MLPQTFTLAQANALVPYLTATFAESRKLARSIRILKGEIADSEKMQRIEIGGRVLNVDPDPQVVRRLRTLEGELRDLMTEVLQLGIEIRRADGLCDFPSWKEGRLVFLCWKYGESEIGFWHPAGKGYEDRQRMSDAVSGRDAN